MESLLITNASLVEDMGDLKQQLNATNSRLTEACSTRSAKKSLSSIDTQKLLAELSAKLFESPEFKDSVLAVIEEHEAELTEEEKETEMLLKPAPFHSVSSFTPYNGFNLTPNSYSKRLVLFSFHLFNPLIPAQLQFVTRLL
jgi:hypothetical protein